MKQSLLLQGNISPHTWGRIDQLCGSGNRSAYMRDLIFRDIQSGLSEGSGLNDVRLRLYRERRAAKTNRRTLHFAVSVDLRDLVLLRTRYLGFTVSEYLAALIAWDFHKKGYYDNVSAC